MGIRKRDIILDVPNLTRNLISASKIRRSGFTVAFESQRNGTETCKVTDSDTNYKYVIRKECENGVYKVLLWPHPKERFVLSSPQLRSP